MVRAHADLLKVIPRSLHGRPILGLRDYLAGPDEALGKVITPFVSTIIGILAYSAMVTIGVTLAVDILSGAILP